MAELVMAPFRRTNVLGLQAWRPPPGFIGCLDLRTSPAQAAVAGPAQGIALFVYAAPQAIPGALELGQDLNRQLTTGEKAQVAARLRVQAPPGNVTLLDMVWNALTLQADPTGQKAPRPLRPTRHGNLALHLGGFSLVRSKPLTETDPEWPLVLASLQLDYAETRAQVAAGKVPANTHLKMLGALQQKYRIRDYRVFIPSGLPDEGMLPPTTSILDDFGRADNGLGANWTADEGTWGILSNQARTTATGTARYSGTTLSTDDHYTEFKMATLGNNGYKGPAVRKIADGTLTFYASLQQTSNNLQIYKRVEGSYSLLQDNANTPANGDTYRIDCDGSTIRHFKNGTQVGNDLTDVTIVNNKQTAMVSNDNAGRYDDFAARDLSGGLPYSSVAVVIGL